MKDIFILCIAALLLYACLNQNSKSAGPANRGNSVSRPDTIPDEKLLASEHYYEDEIRYLPVDTALDRSNTESIFAEVIKRNLTSWVDYYRSVSPEFDLAAMVNTFTSTLAPYEIAFPDSAWMNKYYRLYGPYLKWSPDSSKAIDIYSYRVILEYDTIGNIYGMWDVDCQVNLVDPGQNRFIRLLHHGPVSTFQDACWIGNNSVIITATDIGEDEKYHPSYFLIDLDTYLVRFYTDSAFSGVQDINFLDAVFRDVPFE